MENITKSYKKTNGSNLATVNKEAKKIAKGLGIDERVEKFVEKPCFITLKDHKENFDNNPKCRLINPAKSEIGLISKNYLDKINKEVLAAMKVNQWRNTTTVISWFKAIERKRNCKFFKFDIIDFYPSISEDLFMKAMTHARQHTDVEEKVISIILNARKCFLFNNGQPWAKKENARFDVTMGSFDGAEICELVGLYLLSKIVKIVGINNVGLYRDDGLGYLKGKSKVQTEQIKKKLCQCFKEEGLSITVNTNLIKTDFLDVTFDMTKNVYYPYNKPENSPQYVHSLSNHPPSIIRQIPSMIGKRISDISSGEEQFVKAAPFYQRALHSSGYKEEISFQKPRKKRRNRPRKIIWFNPPFNKAVKGNFGRKFLKLVQKHFPPHHRYYRIFNKNTIKLSYSCSPNMRSIIVKHNMRVLNKKAPAAVQRECNCRVRGECPLNGTCLQRSLVYRADVECEGETASYVGACEGTFKERYRKHKSSFNNRDYENDTELSKHIWALQDETKNFQIKWSVVKKASPYVCGGKKCDLCLTEKTLIGRSEPGELLNKKSEIISKCRHKNKFTLKYGVT